MSELISDNRRRRWDAESTTPISNQKPPSPTKSLPNTQDYPATAVSHIQQVLNVEEAKRLASQRAAQLSSSVKPVLQQQQQQQPVLPTLISNDHVEVAPGIITTARHATASGFTQDVDINDCRNRYLLTKAQTQQEIKRDTGCEITTRGQYLPDRAHATTARPPLHLHMSATTKEALDLAVEKIKDLMDKPTDPALMERASFAPRNERRQDSEDGRPFNERPGPPSALTEKVFIEFGSNDRRFNIRAKVVGPKGAYVKHIQSTTGVRIQLKGQGSGYIDTATGRESDEPLHVFLWTNMGDKALEKAKELLADLLAQVQLDYEKFSEATARAREAVPSNGPYSYNALTPTCSTTNVSDTLDRERDRPSMSQFPPMQPTPPQMDPAYVSGQQPLAYQPVDMMPPTQYLYQPPYAAPEPPKHIVQSAQDMVVYTKYYTMFYAYYYQLVASGQALPVVEVPPPPTIVVQEKDVSTPTIQQVSTDATVSSDTAPAAVSGSVPDAVCPEPPSEIHSQITNEAQVSSGGPPGMDTVEQPAADNAEQWAQYYQYYATSHQGQQPLDPGLGQQGEESLPVNLVAEPSGGGATDDTQLQSQWAAYYAQQYYASAGGEHHPAGESEPGASDLVTE